MKRLPPFSALMLLATAMVHAQQSGNLSWAIRYDPKTFDPTLVDDQASEQVRFLTAGVLLRFNRQSLQAEPALADRYDVSPDGKLVTLHLRAGPAFFGWLAPLPPRTPPLPIRRVLAPTAPVAEEFGDAAHVTVDTPDPATVAVHLPKRVVNLAQVFDEIAIEPATRPSQARITSGPFVLTDYKRGESLTLKRNPYYYKHDSAGHQLPYLDTIQLDILANPEQNELRFLRGQYQLLDPVSADDFLALARKAPGQVKDLGPTLNSEQMWFNQAAAAPIPAYEKAWFGSRNFRTAISYAIHRNDLVRVAYSGHATPANGFISPANSVWYDRTLKPIPQDNAAALNLLAQDGFRKQGGHAGRPRRPPPSSFPCLPTPAIVPAKRCPH